MDISTQSNMKKAKYWRHSIVINLHGGKLVLVQAFSTNVVPWYVKAPIVDKLRTRVVVKQNIVKKLWVRT